MIIKLFSNQSKFPSQFKKHLKTYTHISADKQLAPKPHSNLKRQTSVLHIFRKKKL